MSKIVDAIKELGANPSHGEVSALALVSIARSLEYIAVALEKRQAAVTNVYAPNLRDADVKFRAESPDGKIKSEAVIPRATTSWVTWNGQDRRPWKNLADDSTVRVQFRSNRIISKRTVWTRRKSTGPTLLPIRSSTGVNDTCHRNPSD